jgi:hypothetical protein
MVRILSRKVHDDISAVVDAATRTRNLVQVYAEAEKIRQANLDENIALEDIVQEIMSRSAHGPGYVADPDDALNALLGDSWQAANGETVH